MFIVHYGSHFPSNKSILNIITRFGIEKKGTPTVQIQTMNSSLNNYHLMMYEGSNSSKLYRSQNGNHCH